MLSASRWVCSIVSNSSVNTGGSMKSNYKLFITICDILGPPTELKQQVCHTPPTLGTLYLRHMLKTKAASVIWSGSELFWAIWRRSVCEQFAKVLVSLWWAGAGPAHFNAQNPWVHEADGCFQMSWEQQVFSGHFRHFTELICFFLLRFICSTFYLCSTVSYISRLIFVVFFIIGTALTIFSFAVGFFFICWVFLLLFLITAVLSKSAGQEFSHTISVGNEKRRFI